PLVPAAAAGQFEMVELLLKHGADVDAKSPTKDQRELGAPILLAVEHEHYQVAHLLLDHGADVGAFGYCSSSVADELYESARKAGAEQRMIRKGFERYLGKIDLPAMAADVPEVTRLFERVLSLGAEPSLESIIHDGYGELVEDLLRTAPEAPGSKHDHPAGTVFVNICNGASWGGFQKVLEMAMEICPHLHTPDDARRAISRAIRSHNRYGSVQDYLTLIEEQFQFLEAKGVLESTINEGSLKLHYLLAKDYLWPGWCGPESSPSTVESMIELSELFIRYGFDDLNERDNETGFTPLAAAAERGHHPGLKDYAAYLLETGADGGSQEPEETNPLALARNKRGETTDPEDRKHLDEMIALLRQDSNPSPI
ncbi:MAG: ankyrin repeat domain-containing protein, partial [Verrucomicrobiota bacterium]